MKLITNSGNIQTLKITIAAEFVGFELEYVEVEKEDDVDLPCKQLPVLIVSPSCRLTSGNAACRFLLSSSGSSEDSLGVEQWCEWESSQLLPIVWQYLVQSIGHGKVDAKLIGPLKDLLYELNEGLHLKDLLIGDKVSAADIAIWSTLFPILCDTSSLKEWSQEFRNISQWFNKLSSHSSFQTGFTRVTNGKGLSAFKAALLTLPSPPPVSNSTRKFKQSSHKMTAQVPDTKISQSNEGEQVVTVTADELKIANDNWRNGHIHVPLLRQRKHPILPQEGDRNMLITSALPYVNNVPHLGNIIGCVLSADVYSRFCRLRNYNVLYICGTDEYGTATETKALEEGLTPQQICDKYNALHSEIYDWFNIDFDFFGRTTTQHQTDIAQDIFWKLYHQNCLLKETVEQLQCQQCNRFLADRFVEGTCPLCNYEDARGDQCDKCGKLINATELKNPRCKICGNTPQVKHSEHLFLDLPKLEPQLQAFTEKAFQSGIWTSNAKLITKSWIRDGLKPRCITRDLKWGTPVPLEGFTDKVFYVWFDAPIGYISITANYTDEWEKWWKNPQQVQLYNFMAKDNVPFHSVVFPCSLLGAQDNYTLVNHLSATEYLNYEDGKFSKSRGVGVFGNDAKDTKIPADIWRFYLLFLRPESQDSLFSWDDFVLKNNSELLNNLGNFINRSLMFLANHFGSVIPEIKVNEDDTKLLALITRELKNYIDNLERIRLRDGIRNILSISKLGNQYIQSNKPWVLVKGTEQEKARSGTVTGLAANISCLLSVLLQPYMPDTSQTIHAQLNAPAGCNSLTDRFVCLLPVGHKIGKPSPLFTKIEASFVADLKKKFAGTQQTNKNDMQSKVKPDGLVKATAEEVEALKDKVNDQGNKVRQMKTEKADKDKIAKEVAVLLDLKKKLSLASGYFEAQ